MLRTTIILIFITLLCFANQVCKLIAFFVRKKNPRKADMIGMRVVWVGCRVIRFLAGAKLTVTGLENIPTDVPICVVGNHQSYLDIVITYLYNDRPMGYLSKDLFKKIPGFAGLMKGIHCVFLDRSDIRAGLKSIMEAADNINNGISMCIFPEGTRSKDGRIHEFRAGALKTALKSGCPIVPVAISGSMDLLEKQFPFIYAGPVSLTYGKPIYVSELSPEDKKHISEIVKSEIEKMMPALPAEESPSPEE